MKTLRQLLYVPLLLAGCASPAPVAPLAAPAAAPAAKASVTVVSHLEVRDRAGRRVLAEVQPWGKADIDHVTLTLFQEPVTTPVHTLTIQQADLDRTVTVKDLAIASRYRVEARAWADAAETIRIDDFEDRPAACTTPFTTTTDDMVSVGAIALRLKDKTFVGTATTTGVGVMSGDVHDTTATPTIELF